MKLIFLLLKELVETLGAEGVTTFREKARNKFSQVRILTSANAASKFFKLHIRINIINY